MNRLVLFAVLFLLPCSFASAQESIVPKLLDASVTIRAKGSQGSGVLVTRGDTTYVLTAAHVIDVDGTPKTIVEFGDPEIVQEFSEDGRRIGEAVHTCKVLKYSDADQGEDLALLQVRKKNFSTASVEFVGEEVPVVGEPLTHVGSFLGQQGSNSVSNGLLSQTGRVLTFGVNNVVFDQVSTPGWPGSSGGGVFRSSDGKCVGLLVRGAGETFCLVAPARRMREWAKRSKVEWVLDPTVDVPSREELAKLPIEDNGSSSGGKSEGVKEYPFMLLTLKDSP